MPSPVPGATSPASSATLAAWAERWVDLRTEHTDPGFALWVWCQVQLNRNALPLCRVVVAFTFPDERPGNRRFWLLVENGDAEVCISDPGGDPAAEIVARSRAFIDWHRGVLSWGQALQAGTITVTGRRSITRALPTWNLRQPAATASTPASAVAGRSSTTAPARRLGREARRTAARVRTAER